MQYIVRVTFLKSTPKLHDRLKIIYKYLDNAAITTAAAAAAAAAAIAIVGFFFCSHSHREKNLIFYTVKYYPY